MYLEKINSPSDIKKLSVDEMKKLTQEMRDALIFKAGNGSQFDGFDRCGSHQVRTTAQVGKRALRIGGDVTVFQLRNQLAFISFATVAEHLQSVCL